MRKILITGSNGLVGSEAVAYFQEKGWHVVGVDNNMRTILFGVQAYKPMLELDIREQKDVEGLFQTVKFDAIIHTAAQPSHDWAKKMPLIDFDCNARATLILLEATRMYCPDATFVHVSTDKVYGENMKRDKLDEWPTRYHSDFPYDENLGLDFAGQRSLFGCSKAAADMYAQEYANYFGMKVGIFRPGCITGGKHKGAEEHGFLAYLAKCIKEGLPYKIFGFKGKQVRDQIHAYDLVTAFEQFIEKPKPGAVYNIGGGPDRSLSVLEAIYRLEEETDKKCEYTIEEGRKGDRQWDVHDVSKFQADYPLWGYQYDLEDIIKDLCIK